MKFCYLDESGYGSKDTLVMSGIIVDSHRMHITKKDWKDFFDRLSKVASRPVSEFHARDFYSGNSPWRNVVGPMRSAIIDMILDWLISRKHRITFSAIDSGLFLAEKGTCPLLRGLGTPWRAAALHCILSLQKHHSKEQKTKGHTVLVFDREEEEEKEISKLVWSPPEWTDSYYSRKPREERLNVIVDVPYFSDSEHGLLLQIADLLSYILRRFADLSCGAHSEKYEDEKIKVEGWVEKVLNLAVPSSVRYPKKGRDTASEVFWKVAPECLRV